MLFVMSSIVLYCIISRNFTRFMILGNTGTTFKLSTTNQGEILIDTPPLFDVTPSYTLTITVTDGGTPALLSTVLVVRVYVLCLYCRDIRENGNVKIHPKIRFHFMNPPCVIFIYLPSICLSILYIMTHIYVCRL